MKGEIIMSPLINLYCIYQVCYHITYTYSCIYMVLIYVSRFRYILQYMEFYFIKRRSKETIKFSDDYKYGIFILRQSEQQFKIQSDFGDL